MYKMTASLYNAFLNAHYGDFPKVLRKEEIEITPQIQYGWDFENLVYFLLGLENLREDNPLAGDEKELATAQKMVDTLSNLYVIKGDFIDGEFIVDDLKLSFLLRGCPDLLTPNPTIDIKTTGKYYVGKYFPSIQHLIYSYLLNNNNFVYLINNNGDIYTETYNYSREQIKQLLTDRLKEFVLFLKSNNYFEEYKTIWKIN